MARRCAGGGAEVRHFCAAYALACARCIFGHLGCSLEFPKIALSPARSGPAAYKCSSRLRVVPLLFHRFRKSALARAWCPKLADIRSRLRAVRLRSRLRGVDIFLYSTALSPARRGLLGALFFLTFSKVCSRPRAGPNLALRMTWLIMIIITIMIMMMIIIIIIINITSEGPVV